MISTILNFILGFFGGIIVARVMLFPLYLLQKENEEINEIDELEIEETELDPEIEKHIPRID